MAGRKPYVGGNWKMTQHHAEASALASAIIDRHTFGDQVEVVVFPAYPYIHKVSGLVTDSHSPIKVGAQNASHQKNGAFTGEVSLSMLKDVGTRIVLIGHSERRHLIGESDALINQKVLAALDAEFEIVLCIGENIEQRQAGETDKLNAAQLSDGLADVTNEQMSQVTIAYEPVWAIGTGQTATAKDAQAAHLAIRLWLTDHFHADVANATRIQYGGSVKPSNAEHLFDQPDIDGGLIGGASLNADDFMAIVETAAGIGGERST